MRVALEVVEARVMIASPFYGRRDVAQRRVEPDVKEFAGPVRDGEAEVRPVAADAPVLEPALDPLAHVVRDVGLERARVDPLLEKGDILRGAELEEHMGRFLSDRSPTA